MASAEANSPADPAQQKLLAEAIENSAVVRLYANGFMLGLSNADAYILLQQFGKPTAIINMSYTLAKTLSLRLGRLVAEWETRTGQQLVTTEKIEQAFAKDNSGETKQ
jgi:hypothetical protein